MRNHNSTNENIIIIKLEEKNQTETNERRVCNGLGKKKLESGDYCFNVWEQWFYTTINRRCGEVRDVKLLFSRPEWVYIYIYIQEKDSFNYRPISPFNLFSTGSFPSSVRHVHTISYRCFPPLRITLDDRLRWRAGDEVGRRKTERDRNQHRGLNARRTFFFSPRLIGL